MGARMVWLNGTLVPERDARVSVYDSALMFGDMVFEMTRSFNRVHFQLDEHLDRLFRSAQTLHVPMPYTKDQLHAAVEEVTDANPHGPDDEHRLLLNVSRGTLGLYDGKADAPSGPQVMIADFPLRWTVAGMGALYETGVTVKPVEVPSQPYPHAKHRSRVLFQMANVAAAPHWAVMMTRERFLCEGTGANLVLVTSAGTLASPAALCLPGISRDFVFSLHPGVLGHLRADLLREAREAFFTATPFCLLPITGYCHANRDTVRPIGDGRPGPLTTQLLARWSETVGVDIVGQVQTWDMQHQFGPSTAPTPNHFR